MKAETNNLIKEYRPDIDGLRALSVIVVLMFHAKVPGFSGGYVGVDIFFVISGFLITNNLYKEFNSNKTISFLEFYSKRIKRLFPSIFLVTFTTIIIWLFALSGIPNETSKFGKSITYSVFGLANFFFQQNTNGYFDGPSDEQPMLHFWSLAVEEQFYLIWPLLFLIILKLKPKLKHLILFLIIPTIFSFLLNLYLVYNNKMNLAFFMVPARAWQFAIGAIIPFIKIEERKKSIIKSVFVLGFLLIFFPVFLFDSTTLFPGFNALLPTIGAALIIISGDNKNDFKFKKILTSRYVVYLGTLSYGIYLWHWPLLSISQIYNYGIQTSYFVKMSIVLLSIGLAYLTFEYLEKPIRFGTLKHLSSKITIGSFLVLSLILSSMIPLSKTFNVDSKNDNLLRLISERTPLMEACLNKPENIGSTNCSTSSTLKSSSNVYVFGDSHAFSIFPMIDNFSRKYSVHAFLYSNSSSPPLLEVEGFFIENEKRNAEVNKVNRMIIRNIHQNITMNPSANHSVLIASRWMRYFGDNEISLAGYHSYLDTKKTEEGSYRIFMKSLTYTIRELKNIGVNKILILLPTPEFKTSSHNCLRRDVSNCFTTREDHERYVRRVKVMLRSIERKYSNVVTIDPALYFCSSTICPQFVPVGNELIPAVFDTNHHSVRYSLLLGEKIHDQLVWLVN